MLMIRAGEQNRAVGSATSPMGPQPMPGCTRPFSKPHATAVVSVSPSITSAFWFGPRQTGVLLGDRLSRAAVAIAASGRHGGADLGQGRGLDQAAALTGDMHPADAPGQAKWPRAQERMRQTHGPDTWVRGV
jgi:hypothetical protein